MRKAMLSLLAILVLGSCMAERTVTTADGDGASVVHPAWSRNAVIYEVNVRQYTPAGTFAAFEGHLARLRSMGVDILWFMPVQPIGVENRKGTLGSYYSISNYTAINPEYGDEADFRAVVDSAHALGMKVILDWVANHTAFDHSWTTEHKDWYTLRPDGTISNALDNEGNQTDWTDVAELNYESAAMRQAMIGEMKWWLDTMGIDGFRCDVAGGVPADFWAEARQALVADRPDLFMLAEAEDPALQASFDMTYGWQLHHLLNGIAQGSESTALLNAYFAEQDTLYPRGAFRMYFTSNHDENSWNGSEFERMGANHEPAFVLAATVENSMPLLYTGQEAGMTKRLRFFDKDTVDWSDLSLTAFYRTVFALKHLEPALANGAWGGAQAVLQTDGGDHVWAFTRTREPNTVLVAVNFGDADATVTYTGLPRPGAYTDWFDRSLVELAPAGTLAIPAHGFRVLVR